MTFRSWTQTLASLLLLLSAPAYAQLTPVCQSTSPYSLPTLGMATSYGTYCVEGGSVPGPAAGGVHSKQISLSEALQVLQLEALTKQIEAINSLQKSVDAYHAVIYGDVKQWQASTLTSALERLDRIPLAVANNDSVVRVLSAQLKAQLVADREFTRAVRDAGARGAGE